MQSTARSTGRYRQELTVRRAHLWENQSTLAASNKLRQVPKRHATAPSERSGAHSQLRPTQVPKLLKRRVAPRPPVVETLPRRTVRNANKFGDVLFCAKPEFINETSAQSRPPALEYIEVVFITRKPVRAGGAGDVDPKGVFRVGSVGKGPYPW
mmetsp:Transcript_49392/g.131041  ORF Transcript_49392/g.131041 Transcript_49392/m.131041 type:complete len:154 (-) Transcript_49392:332-793(-)